MNALTTALAAVCRDQPLSEKWLIAPSRRVGHQWLELLARNDRPALNVRIKTLRSMAVDLAAPEMARRGLSLATPKAAVLLMDRALRRLGDRDLRYLTGLQSGLRLAEAVLASIHALRIADLDAGGLSPSAFEVPEKSRDFQTILRAGRAELEREQLVDEAAVLRMAVDRLERDSGRLGDDMLVLIPEDLRCVGLRQRLLDAVSEQCRRTLPVDEPDHDAAHDPVGSDAELLRWLPAPGSAPQPASDGSVDLFRAVGEANEIREVLRRCLAGEVPLDDVELLHTDRETYLPLIYETLLSLEHGDDAEAELPATFAEGLPCRFARPGRALAAWQQWVREDFPQTGLLNMIREGLLELPAPGAERPVGFHRLAALLRRVGIGRGRDRYLPKTREQIEAFERQIARARRAFDEDGDDAPRRIEALERRLGELQILERLLEQLLEISPDASSGWGEILAAAERFLGSAARRAEQFDQFAAVKLTEEIQDLIHWLSRSDAPADFDVWAWLAALPGEARVMGSGPRPGRLHVDSVYSGGHSGRGHTFIVGLDDGRFPGAGLQDPLLLDSERGKLSPHIPTAAGRTGEALDDFARLLARLRGRVILSFACYDVVEDRELFPSPGFLAAFRLLSGSPDADQSELPDRLAAPSSFAPSEPGKALTSAEWWLWRLCGPERIESPRELVLRHFTHLAQGRRAAEQRQRPEFTEYDGRVAEAGRDLDPTADHGLVLSPNAVQTAGRCPRAFFFKYALGLEKPDEVQIDPDVWLDALSYGLLLHELFERFVRELVDQGGTPQFERDRPRLMKLLDGYVRKYEDLVVPPNRSAYERQCRQLRQTAETFLREEERLCREHAARPAYFETCLGMATDGDGIGLDTPDPIAVPLSQDQSVRLRGRIDRVDRLGNAGRVYCVWDYKSGSTYGYDRADPFRQGRLMQPYLYLTIVAHRLRSAVSPDAEVGQFGFFFPGVRAVGERVVWTSEELAAGREILQRICETITGGAFPATTDHDTDCRYCDYRTICGDVGSVAEASRRMLEHPANGGLTPLRDLRAQA